MTWHCRAGGRFLYICEDGLVHYCSQQRGRPGIPLSQYTREDWCAKLLNLKDAPRSARFRVCIRHQCWMNFANGRMRL